MALSTNEVVKNGKSNLYSINAIGSYPTDRIYRSIGMINRAKAFLEVLTNESMLNNFIEKKLIEHKGFMFSSRLGVCSNIQLCGDTMSDCYMADRGIEGQRGLPCNVDIQEFMKQVQSNTLYPSEKRIDFLEYVIENAVL